MKFAVPRIALRTAAETCPVVVQRFESVHDLITPIRVGDETRGGVPVEPTVYYSVKRDDLYDYGLFCFFHDMDWSDWIWPFKVFDEHKYDFEGCLVVRNRSTGRLEYLITVSHLNFIYASSFMLSGGRPLIGIEYGGHGIHPNPVLPGENRIVYKEFKMVNMADKRTMFWLKHGVEPHFDLHGVHLPWSWNDENLVTHYGREATEGLLWRNPARLIELAKKAGLLGGNVHN